MMAVVEIVLEVVVMRVMVAVKVELVVNLKSKTLLTKRIRMCFISLLRIYKYRIGLLRICRHP